jgi:hypothetical protein
MGSRRKKRTLFRLVVAAGIALGAGHAAGCTTATFSERAPCRGSSCACEEDPEQPLCKGFNQRDDASLTEPFDAAPQDASEGGVADDAPSDGGDDARDGSDSDSDAG